MALPHVTEILRDAGLVDVSFVRQEHLDRGSAVHAATHYHDEGDLDVESLDESVRPRFDGYLRFLRDCNPEILAIERYVENQDLGYCGTLDRIVRIGGELGVLDIKGAIVSPWHGVQCEAYRQAIRTFNSEPVVRRWNLYLRDGDYRLEPRTDRDDWTMFKFALSLKSWRQRNAA